MTTTSLLTRNRLFSLRRHRPARKPYNRLLWHRRLGIEPLEQRRLLSVTVSTDKPDYPPGATALISASGFDPGSTVQFQVLHTDGTSNTGTEDQPWSVTDGVASDLDGVVNGAIQTTWCVVPGTTYSLTATGLVNGQMTTVTTTFTDSNPTANLDDFANGPLNGSPLGWGQGNLSSSKAHYFEGDSVPFRFVFTNLIGGTTYSITIGYDTTTGGKHAFDYLTSFDRTVPLPTSDPLSGTSLDPVNHNPSPTSTIAIPIDPNVTKGEDGILGTGDDITQIPGVFSLYNATAQSVSGYTVSGSYASDSTTDITVTFTTSGTTSDTNVTSVLAWGTHIATRADWGVNNSAVDISGSPYHVSRDGGVGSGSQDHQIQSDAVIFPASITVVKSISPLANDPQTFNFSTTGGLTPSTFTLDVNSDPTYSNTQVFSGIINFTQYTITEAATAGWNLSNVVFTVTDANGGTQTFSGSTATISLAEGENVTATFQNLKLTTISGTKFNDLTGNGFSNDDTPLSSNTQPVTIDLLDASNAVVATTTTDSNGNYSFTGVGPGTYTVAEVVPTGWIKTAETGATITAASGFSSTGNNFDDFKLGTISGTKFNDLTGNGFSNDDTPLSSNTQPVTIDLLDASNAVVATTTTDSNGNYSFTGVGPGTYTVAEVVPTGWIKTAETGATITAASGFSSTGNNFDDFKLGTISGTKFNDLTGNGFSNDDTPLSSNTQPVTIDLLDASNAVVATTTTDSNGNYSFTGVGPGTYTVAEVVPTGWIKTAETGATITAASGFSSTGNNFDDFKLGTISGTKFNDLTGNGFSNDDTPLSSNTQPVTIDLLDASNAVVATTTTDSNGNYSFTGVGPGTYTVAEVVPTGWIKTAETGATITAASGFSSTGNNFDDFKLGTISGTKFNDLTGNGFSNDDTPLSSNTQPVTIDLLDASNAVVATTTTDSNGNYSFTGVGPGTYTVAEVVPTGWIKTAETGATITAASGFSSTGNNFDDFKLGTISGTKFNDLTGNGFSNDDTPLSSNTQPVTIDLLDASNAVVATTTTDSNGNYSFTGVGPGTYTVAEVVPTGWIKTAETGATITAASGFSSTGNNFDDFKLGTISGTKFNDLTGNGFSNDDTPLSSNTQPVTIDLLDASNAVVATTTTDSNGNYSFTGVGPGTYTVAEVVPTGWIKTAETGATITAASGFSSTGNNFDDFKLGTISGTKFNDLTGNGFSNDDTPLSSNTQPVTIDLLDASNAVVATTTTDSNGNYSFTGVGPGTYTVAEVVPTGWIKTAETGATITAASGFSSTGNNFDDFKLGTISGTKFNDLTGNGFSNDDTPLSSNTQPVTIDLLDASNAVVATTTTDSNGNYSFTGVGPGTYTVAEVVPTGWIKTAETGATITAASGFSSTGNNFDDFKLGTISGTKFNDLTGNGFSNDDTPLSSNTQPVTIDLLDASNAVVATTTTDSNGNYSFTGVGPGTYTVAEVVPTGWIKTAETGATITAASGFSSTGNNFDDFKLGTISGTKFNDPTGNGFSNDDTPLSSNTQPVTIDLLDASNAVVATTTTDSNGNYSFTGVGPGTYTVAEVVPTGWIKTAETGATITAASGFSSTGNNFDDFKLGTISGTKFNDLTGNGFSNDDTPLSSNTQPVTIDLLDASNAVVATTTTDSNGNYSFTGVGPGTYTVAEVVPTGWIKTAETGATITAASGFSSTGNNFDDFKLGTISGTKFNDLTGNGFSNDDTPLSSNTQPVTIDLLDASNAVVATTTTDSNGNYSFTGVGPGTYTVAEVVPTGWIKTAETGATITAASGFSSTGNNFDDFKLGTISGTKFNDLTGNGFSNDDTPLSSNTQPVTIDLLDASNAVVATTTTDSNGNYSFTGVGPGTYTVAEVVPTGWIKTAETGATITAASGFSSTGNNFDDFKLGTISGTKFNDLTGNGFSNDDTPLSSNTQPVTIDLLDASNAVVATTTTDSNGNYSFTGVGPGTYTVAEVVPTGWIKTAETGATITAASGFSSTGNNFDDFKLGTISGTKFNDLTGNGFSNDDTPLSSNTQPVTIDLLDASNAVVATTTTDSNGNYSFTGVGPGTYTVAEVVPTGWIKTAETGATITAASGFSSTGNNFDDFQLPTAPEPTLALITGMKFEDHNGNGVKDAGDQGLSGWTIQLFLDSNGNNMLDIGVDQLVATTTTDTSGNYSFSVEVSAAGRYFIREVQQSGWTQTTPNPVDLVFAQTENEISLSSGSLFDNTFGNFKNFTISGTKFCDENVNGTKDGSDHGLAGWTILLDKLDPNAVNHVLSTVFRVTGVNGAYSFANLGPGMYRVREVQKTKWVQTSVNPAVITGSSGTNLANVNFGNIQVMGSSARPLSFWTGQGLGVLTFADINALNALYLSNANGTDFGLSTSSLVTARNQLRTWLLGASSTANVTYRLSAQLATLTLSVRHGVVGLNEIVYAPGLGNIAPTNNFITIGSLLTTANNQLFNHNATLALANVLAATNNNRNFARCDPPVPRPCR